jgi:hypothetical protein
MTERWSKLDAAQVADINDRKVEERYLRNLLSYKRHYPDAAISDLAEHLHGQEQAVRWTDKRRVAQGDEIGPAGKSNSALNRTKLWQRLLTGEPVTVEWGTNGRQLNPPRGDHNGVYGRRDKKLAQAMIRKERVIALESRADRYVLKIAPWINRFNNLDERVIDTGFSGFRAGMAPAMNPYQRRVDNKRGKPMVAFLAALDNTLSMTCGD